MGPSNAYINAGIRIGKVCLQLITDFFTTVFVVGGGIGK